MSAGISISACNAYEATTIYYGCFRCFKEENELLRLFIYYIYLLCICKFLENIY